MPIRHYLEHYFAFHPSQEVKEMFWATAIRSLAVSAVGIFEPIYLFKLGFTIPQILLYYVAMYVGYFLLVPLGGRICRRHGYEHTILFSSPFLIIYYLALFAIPFSRFFLAVAVIALVIEKVLYWPGYHANFATWMNGNEAGREVSNRIAITAMAAAFAPIAGGAVIVFAGFGSLFVGVAVLVLLSNLPLLRTPELFSPTNFAYSGAFSRLINGLAKPKFWTHFGFGEQLVSLAVWPIFVAVMVPSLLSVGAIISLSKFVNVMVTLYVGRLSDEERKDNVLHSGTVFTAASWLMRPFVTGPFGAFLIDSYYQVARNMIAVPFFSMMYSQARDGEVMSSIIFNEMSLALGKIVMALIAISAFVIFPTAPWTALFVAAAVFTLFYSLMPLAIRRVRPAEVPVPVAKVENPGA